MCRWIANSLGTDHPIHFTAFHPDYKLRDASPTPPATLRGAAGIARDSGLRYVYLGNLPEEGNTACPRCGTVLVRRSFRGSETDITGEGTCRCGEKIPGVWK